MKILSALMLLFLMGVFVMPPILVWAQANPVTIVVPDNYSTIASAIQHASSGDTIFVKSGLYHESLVVDKSLLVMGENSTNTTIIGVGGAGSSVFTVSANNVEISGFTIQSRSYSSPSDYSLGIDVAADNCSITGNNITNTYIGIYVGGSGNLCGGKSSVIISRNNITANVEDGILFYGDSSNVISENNITGNNATGIALDGYSNIISKNNISGNKGGIGLASSNSVIFGNNITGNRDWGLYFETYNNIVSNNYIAASTWGIYLSPIFAPSNNKFYHNDLINNDVQVYTGSAYNMQVWDDGYPSGGNYWSHYLAKYPNATKLDDSGIWDTPFVLGANNTDRYPLISPFSILATDSPPPLPAIPCQNGAFWLFNTVEPNSTTPDTLGQNPAVLAPVTENVTSPPVPSLVKGRFGNALSFDFPHYVWAAESPSLNIAEDLTIDVWINVKAFEDTTYNNIAVYTVETLGPEARIYGLSFNGMSPPNATSGPTGALTGYVFTSQGYNQIVTVGSGITLNQWTHVVFTRSVATGMHIYVNVKEEKIMVTSGLQNPKGFIKKGTDLYIGHDFGGLMEDLSITNGAAQSVNAVFWILVWLIVAAAVVIAVLAVEIYWSRRGKK